MKASLSWYKKMYVWFKRLPILAFWFGPIEGLVFGIFDHIDLWLFDPEWLALLIWPIAGFVAGLINYVVASIFLSPIILRTSAAIGEVEEEEEYGEDEDEDEDEDELDAVGDDTTQRVSSAPQNATGKEETPVPVAISAEEPQECESEECEKFIYAPSENVEDEENVLWYRCILCGEETSVPIDYEGNKIYCHHCHAMIDISFGEE